MIYLCVCLRSTAILSRAEVFLLSKQQPAIDFRETCEANHFGESAYTDELLVVISCLLLLWEKMEVQAGHVVLIIIAQRIAQVPNGDIESFQLS